MPDPVLDPKFHERLLGDIENVCDMAGVPASFLKRSATEFCSEEQIAWLKSFPHLRQSGPFGAYIEGQCLPSSDVVFQSMAAALLRNFIDARVMTVNTVLDLRKDRSRDMVDPTVMFVPNFHIVMHGKPFTGWEVQTLYDVLMDRNVRGRFTVLYAESLDKMKSDYGLGMHSHILTNYQRI